MNTYYIAALKQSREVWENRRPREKSQEVPLQIIIVLALMKMGNIVPRARIEHTSLTFWDSVLTISPSMLADITTVHIPVILCSSLPE